MRAGRATHPVRHRDADDRLCRCCGKPIEPFWWQRTDDEDLEDLGAFLTGIVGIAMIATLVRPGDQTAAVIDAMVEAMKRRGNEQSGQSDVDAQP